MQTSNNLQFVDLGLMPYQEAWDLQKDEFQKAIDLKRNNVQLETEKIFLVEHTHVYTLGFHGKADNMLADVGFLKDRGIELVHIERGGDITYHGPGQLVVYPIIDLKKHDLGVKSYIHLLEETIIRLLDRYGIKGDRVEGATGVWIDKDTQFERKICAIGVKCSRFITMHGLALNINTDLSYFSAINPCGFINKGVTSIEKELGHTIDMNEVKLHFKDIFSELLK